MNKNTIFFSITLALLMLIFSIFLYLIIKFSPKKKSKINYKLLIVYLKRNYLELILIVIFFSYVFWARVILVRLPKDLATLNFNFFQTLTIILLCIYFGIRMLIKLYDILESLNIISIKNESKLQKYNDIFLQNNVVQYINELITNLPINVFNIFYFGYSDHDKIVQLQNIFMRYIFQEKKYIKYIYFAIESIRIFICLTFFIEIVFIKKIYFFYKLLFLLLLVLLYHVFIYFLFTHAWIEYFKTQKEIKFTVDNSDRTNFKIFFENPKDGMNKYLALQIYKCYKIMEYKVIYEGYTEKYQKYIFFFYYLIYCLSFLFYLLILMKIY